MAEATGLVGKVEADLENKASAGKFHHMFAGRQGEWLKATPGKIKSCELLEGDWGKLGSVVIWNYVHNGEAAMTKKRVEAVDPENNLIKFMIVEGDVMKDYKSFVSTVQATPKLGEPGSVVNWHMEYEKISEDAGHPETILQLAVEISKDIDEYLLKEE
ncbi:hypothetical protein Bca4012_057537 [Brassica carinata]